MELSVHKCRLCLLNNGVASLLKIKFESGNLVEFLQTKCEVNIKGSGQYTSVCEDCLDKLIDIKGAFDTFQKTEEKFWNLMKQASPPLYKPVTKPEATFQPPIPDIQVFRTSANEIQKPIKTEPIEDQEMILGFDANELIEEDVLDNNDSQIQEFVDYENVKKTMQHYGEPYINGPSTSSFGYPSFSTDIPQKKIALKKQIKCEICSKQFPRDKLAEHLNEAHHDEELHKCEYCLLAFSSLELAQRHMKKHQTSAERRERAFVKKEKDHQNGNINKCHLCPEVFKYNKDLLEHLKNLHVNEDITFYQCSLCSKTYSSEMKLQKHNYHSHSGRENTFVCGQCGKSFCKKQTLQEHENTHSGIVNYKCELCAKEFTYKSSFERHKLYHSDDRKHVCELCPKSYKTVTQLSIHKRVHTGERPFACPVCDNRFIDSSSMIKHRQRVHHLK